MTRQLEPGRIRRALLLDVEHSPSGYRVSGGRMPHVVTLVAGQLACDCQDAACRPNVACKHVLAAHLRIRLGPTLFGAIRDALHGEVAT